VEFDDGIVAYSTGYQTMSGIGFTLDSSAADAFLDRELLVLAHDRGYRYLASHYYMSEFGLDVDSSSDQIRGSLGNVPGASSQDLEDFEFSIEYIEPTAPTVFIRFDRIGSEDE